MYNFSCILVSTWCLGERSEQPKGSREAKCSGQAGQCNSLTDGGLSETSLQKAQEEGSICGE